MVSNEEKNFLRIVYLNYRVATVALKRFFDRLHPNLSADLNNPVNKAILQQLYNPVPGKKRVLYDGQWKILYPKTGLPTVTSADLDLTLIVCLLRNIPPLLKAPVNGFDELPHPHDKCEGANIARLKYYKTFLVSHSKDGILSDPDFNRIWNDFEQTITSLDNSAVTASCLKDAKTLILDDKSIALMLSTNLQLDSKVSNLQDDLKHISSYVDKETHEKNKHEIKNLGDRLKVTDDNLKKEIGKCKENIDELSEKLNTSEVVIFERIGNSETYLEELQNMQQLLNLKFNSLEIIIKENKKVNEDFSKEVQSLCSMTQESINKQKERDERGYALQADVDNLKLKLEDIRAEMKKQEQDIIPKFIRAQFEREISEWEKDSSSFVVTRATQNIQQCLLFNNCIVVTGSSGCGKSSNIHHVALHLRDSFGYEIIPFVTGTTDILNYLNESKKQVFVVDDICGKETINTQLFMMWRDFSEQIEKIFRIADNDVEHKNDGAVIELSDPKLLVSCRLHIYKEPQFQLLTALTRMECNLLSSELCLVHEEKRCIIKKYLPDDIFNNLPKTLIGENTEFFPLLCKLSKNKTLENVIKLFTAPVKSITKNINHIISSNKTQFCALVLCILFDNGFNTDWLKLKTVPRTKNVKLEHILKLFEIDVNNEMSRNSLKFGFTTLDGTFIKRTGRLYRMIHDKIYKMAAVICGQQLTECFIKYAPSIFIRDHFIFEYITKNEANDDCIILSDDMEEVYFVRLLSDLSNFVITSTFHNKQLIYPSFMCKLISFFGRSDEVKVILKLCDTKGCYISDVTFITTPLIESSSRGYLDIVHFLIVSIECNVNKVDVNGNTPLNKASQGGKTDVVKFLLDSNADISLCNYEGKSPLDFACARGYADIVQLLLQKKADASRSKRYVECPLFVACKRGYTDIVKLLLEYNADVSQSNVLGESPLYAACKGGYTDLVQLLLQSFADVSQCSTVGESPLNVACKEGCKDIVELLLHNKADVSLCNSEGEFPLHLACAGGYQEIVKILLQNNAVIFHCSNKGESPLYAACSGGHTDTVRLLLQNNADVSQCNRVGESPLYSACKIGCIDTVKVLLKSLADVSHCSSVGESPLYVACKGGHTDTVKLLLQSNADISQCDENGESPLYVACKGGHIEIVKLLLQNNADISKCNNVGYCPLHIACLIGHTNTVKLLLQMAADVSQCDDNGESPLHAACQRGHIEIVKLLLQNKAHISQCNRDGQSPLFVSCRKGYADTLRLLLQYKADVSQWDDNGESPLYAACQGGHIQTVKLLLQNKADISQCNRDGQSPLFVSCRKGCSETVRLLLEYKADVNQCEQKNGASPLHVVCKYLQCDCFLNYPVYPDAILEEVYLEHVEYLKIVKMLIARNADLTRCDKQGQTPLDVVRHAYCSETVSLLEKHLKMKSEY